ncbi:MAG TPA: DUF2071 domain-containing protein [Thermoanaerobaculia bacterium]|nr:DUF2071 domain-containing protein [Thermoanaerobaculia bacterium]
MKLRTVVRDCLFLNWALPVEALPEPPPPLRYQRHGWQGRDHVFVSALLFHHDAVRWSFLPLLRVGYPQLNVRLYVLDEDGVPAVLFQRELMPAWVAPGVRLVSHHPAASARLDFPRPSRQAGADSWQWRAERGGILTVRAWVHSPTFGEGPRIGSWEETVRYFQDRPRGYAVHGGALHRVDASHPPVEAVWPLAAEVGGDALLHRLLPLVQSGQSGLGGQSVPNVPGPPGMPGQTAPAARPPQDGHGAWPALHSSWLCPEMPFSIAFDLVPKVHPVVQHLPHPAAGRIGSPAFLGEPQPAAPVHAQRTHGAEPPAVQPAGRAERAKQVKSAEIAAGAGVLASAA